MFFFGTSWAWRENTRAHKYTTNVIYLLQYEIQQPIFCVKWIVSRARLEMWISLSIARSLARFISARRSGDVRVVAPLFWNCSRFLSLLLFARSCCAHGKNRCVPWMSSQVEFDCFRHFASAENWDEWRNVRCFRTCDSFDSKWFK